MVALAASSATVWRQDPVGVGSITLAQASAGAAATPPTTGTTLITAAPTRHGAAANPQPPSDPQPSATAAARNHRLP